MNRIAGILNLDHAPVYAEEIQRMLDALKHHPLDRQQTWVEGIAGFGCTRPVRFGRLGRVSGEPGDPLISIFSSEEMMITFDGRIDNREELLALLPSELLPGCARILDQELVLAAYAKWELDCPRHLIGDFAFAIWDGKRQRLVCGRDHFGAKPLYYSLSKGSFVFASTPLAILASGKVSPQIHEERIADHLVNPLEGVDKSSSFYMNVYRLPPAHILVLEAGRKRLQQYWELCPIFPSGLKTEQEYIEAFRELFAEAVRCRLRNVPNPASMLSGGMDSSAIVGIARKSLAKEDRCLHALAVISNFPETNRETSSISSVLQQGNLQPHLISETEVSLWMDDLVQAIEREAEPFDCLMNLNRAVYLNAQRRGIDVLLDGVDGDVLLSDSGYLIQLWHAGAWRAILQETLHAEGLIAEYKIGRRKFLNSLLSTITGFVPDWLRKPRRQRRYRNAVDAAARDTIINPDFAVRSRLGERLARLDLHNPRPSSLTQGEFHKIALEHPFLTVGLERYERVASAFGIEARHPFIDARLAQFCLGLPWQLKTQHGWTKMILRQALEPDLPPDVIWRKDKDSLMWEINRLLLRNRAEYFYQVTLDERENLNPYVDTKKLMNYWKAYRSLGDEQHADLIWSGIALAFWLRRHKNLHAAL